tara:strand:- start:19530 stop:20069 length:540 start_codon:yes stop_codon:yes gene_type:complete
MFSKFCFICVFVFGFYVQSSAQNQQLFTSQQFRLGERIIRIAQPGQLADSVNVWGDVGSSGRYLIPKGTRLPELITYALGPNTLRDSQTNVDWSKMRVEINIHDYDLAENKPVFTKLEYKFEEPFPDGMKDFLIKNGQTISVRMKRKPSFRDYVGVIAPVISAIATTITTAILLSDSRN